MVLPGLVVFAQLCLKNWTGMKNNFESFGAFIMTVVSGRRE